MGCKGGGTGTLAIVSASETRNQIQPNLTAAVYRDNGDGLATIILSDIPLEDLKNGQFGSGQVIALDMFLRPKAGATPIAAESTNCTIRHIVFSGDRIVGVYGGGGFLYPAKKWLGGSAFNGNLFNSTLRLIASSQGFSDRLGTAEMSGKLNASQDNAAVDAVTVQLNTEVSTRLGKLFFVLSD